MKTADKDDNKTKECQCHRGSDEIKNAGTNLGTQECCCHENIEEGHNSECHCHEIEEECCHHNLREKQCSCHSETNEIQSDCHCHKHEEHTACGCGSSGHEEGTCACCDLKADYQVSEEKKKKELSKNIAILSISLIFLIIGVLPWAKDGKFKFLPFYYVNPAWVTVIICGWKIVYNAFKNLFKGKLTTPLLITLAMLGSIVIEILILTGVNKTPHGDVNKFDGLFKSGHQHSNIFAAGEIAFLMFLGEFLEGITVKKCRSGIERLVGLIPQNANVITSDGIVSVPLERINKGDIVLIKPGEQISVDGEIIEGHASIDQSSLTGEYIPVDLGVGDHVYGGTFNKDGVFKVVVEKKKEDMIISKMANLTIEAEGKKAPVARVADKWSKVIVPIVLVLSVLVGLISKFALSHGSTDAKYNWQAVSNAITVLVVFCPCALVLATPTAIAAGLGHAAKKGVLIKSGAMLEELSRIKNVCFDKTGTLTEGKIAVEKFIVSDTSKEDKYKGIVKSMESVSEHPLAKAILEYSKDIKGFNISADDIKVNPGVGIMCKYSGKEYSLISISKINQEMPEMFEEEIKDAKASGKTITVLQENSTVVAIIIFTDTLKINAAEEIAELNNSGYSTIMLTGDNAESASFTGKKLNISKVYSQLLPEDKLNKIYEIQKDGKTAMVGDGVNDAPSLKAANCSFAVAGIGSDTAIDSADMTIMDGDISKVSYMLKYSKKVLNIIKTNIAVAMTVNLVAVILAMFGFINPILGALIHNCTSVTVVLISASLLRIRGKELKKLKAKA